MLVSELTLKRGDRLYTSESDVCRRQILTFKDALTELKKNFWSKWFIQEIFVSVVSIIGRKGHNLRGWSSEKVP